MIDSRSRLRRHGAQTLVASADDITIDLLRLGASLVAFATAIVLTLAS